MPFIFISFVFDADISVSAAAELFDITPPYFSDADAAFRCDAILPPPDTLDALPPPRFFERRFIFAAFSRWHYSRGAFHDIFAATTLIRMPCHAMPPASPILIIYAIHFDAELSHAASAFA